MRLRSSQFVFLLLLVCSVQGRDGYALHLTADAVSGPTSTELRHDKTTSVAAPLSFPASRPAKLPPPETRLDAASLAAHSAPWSMRCPALESAAVSSFTGFRRA